MDISIIIVSYNVKEYLLKCLQSVVLFCTGNYQYEIIIVDNASADGSSDAVKKMFPDITLIQNTENLGFSKAVNQGCTPAKGKYIFILNPDTQFTEDSLALLFAEMERDTSLGIVAPMLVNNQQNRQQSYWRKPTLLNSIGSILHLDNLLWEKNYRHQNHDSPLEPDCVSGAAIFIRKHILETLNGLNDTLFWMEDMDLCLRVKTLGYKILYTPQTQIIHHVGKSSEKNQRVTISNQILSKIKYFKIHHSKTATIVLSVVIFMAVILKGILFSLLFPMGKVYKKKAVAYLYTFNLLIHRNY